MNRILLSGFIGQDAEVKIFDWGEVMKFSLATTEAWVKDGEKKSDTTWHNIEKVGKNLDKFAQHLKKGVAVEVIGKQENRKVDDKYFSSVRADAINFCPARKNDEQERSPSGGVTPNDVPPDPDEYNFPF